MPPPFLRCRNLTKSMPDSSGVKILKGIDFEIDLGQSFAIIGASGSGKTTLLHLLALLERPSDGAIEFLGKRVTVADGDQMRRHLLGVVFQAFYLIEGWSVLDNVMLPALICGDQLPPAHRRAEQLLEQMHLDHRKKALAQTLSGGEKQRLCMARALLRRPKLILADEFTGNLDSATSIDIQNLLFEQIKNEGSALILVTHDQKLAQRCQRCYQLSEGSLSEISE